MTRNEAYIILNMLPRIGPVRVRQMLDHYDGPEAILRERADTLSKFPGIGSKIAHIISHWQSEADLGAELDLAARAGVTILTLDDDSYPSLLKEIYDPPLALYVRGNMDAFEAADRSSLAIVGSRRHSRYGLAMTEKLTCGALAAGFAIISGLARGIDTVAHQAVVKAGGTTIAVLGGGLGKIYPPENMSLARAICDMGALVSEQPMAVTPDKRTFPMRNRIIAGMSAGTLVVEAGIQSGALITANQALEQGRTVFAVPGRIDSPMSKGCHQLIKLGAKLVETVDDIIEEFTFLPDFQPGQGPTTEGVAGPPMPVLSDTELSIVKLLKIDRELGFDDIHAGCDRPVQQLLVALSSLEIKRVVLQTPGKRFSLFEHVT